MFSLAGIGLDVYHQVMKLDIVFLRYTDSNLNSLTRHSCDTCWRLTELVC